MSCAALVARRWPGRCADRDQECPKFLARTGQVPQTRWQCLTFVGAGHTPHKHQDKRSRTKDQIQSKRSRARPQRSRTRATPPSPRAGRRCSRRRGLRDPGGTHGMFFTRAADMCLPPDAVGAPGRSSPRRPKPSSPAHGLGLGQPHAMGREIPQHRRTLDRLDGPGPHRGAGLSGASRARRNAHVVSPVVGSLSSIRGSMPSGGRGQRAADDHDVATQVVRGLASLPVTVSPAASPSPEPSTGPPSRRTIQRIALYIVSWRLRWTRR